MITLTAESRCYGNTSQYIARITGRDPKFTFAREFTGAKNLNMTTAYVDEPGLYEVVEIDKKGRKDISYAIVIRRPADCPPLTPTGNRELMRFWGTAEDAAKLSRRIEVGEDLSEIIAVTKEGLDADAKYVYRLRDKGEAKRASAAATVDAAVEQCWAVLQAFPEREAKKVLAALKDRVSPPKPKAEAAEESGNEYNGEGAG